MWLKTTNIWVSTSILMLWRILHFSPPKWQKHKEGYDLTELYCNILFSFNFRFKMPLWGLLNLHLCLFWNQILSYYSFVCLGLEIRTTNLSPLHFFCTLLLWLLFQERWHHLPWTCKLCKNQHLMHSHQTHIWRKAAWGEVQTCTLW